MSGAPNDPSDLTRGKARTWLAQLGRLGSDDLRLVGQLVDQLVVAERGRADTARVMLDARPEPESHDDARARIRAVVGYLEGNRMNGGHAGREAGA